MKNDGKVYLVGAGPGTADLLTVRGAKALAQADCVVYDKLIDPRLLDQAPASAERIYVGKQASAHCMPQNQINAVLIDQAKRGRTVVRLKGGDPLLFARGGEEAKALRQAGVDFEIVPGVTAALAAAATAGVPLTHRSISSAVVFVTGHEDPTKPDSLDWAPLANFPGTLAVYMALTRIAAVAEELIRLGKDCRTQVLLVEWGGTNRQKTHSSTLQRLADGESTALKSPVLAIIGPVCALRDELAWFERRPLFGKTVLVLRAANQSTETIERLESLGAVAICEPAFDILPPEDWRPVDNAIEELDRYDWLVFTSRNGVESFLDRLLKTGRDLRALGRLRIAAIGPGTDAALRERFLHADLIPDEYRSESLAAALAEQAKGKRVLLARANRGRTVLFDELEKVAQRVVQITVYRQVDREKPTNETLTLLRSGKVDYVLFSSSNMASGFFRWLDGETAAAVRQNVRLASISPVTTQRAAQEGYQIAIEATEYTLDGLIDAIVADCESSRD